jgi:hypothetical protein
MEYSVGNLVAGIYFFFGTLIRLYVRRKFRRYFCFFITDKNGDEIRITDAHDFDGFVSSEIPSVIILPTVCVPYTDGINLLVKLYNGVVDYLKKEYVGDERIHDMQILNLIREFELRRM